MKSMRIVIGAVVALVFVLSTSSTPASGGPTGNAVTAWNQIAVNTLIGLPGPAAGPAGRAGPRGNGPGSGVRRGQRDRAQAPPAVSAEAALLRDGLEGRRRRDRGLRRPPQHRRPPCPNLPRHGAGRACCESLATQYASSLAAIPERPVQETGDRRRERRGRRHDRGPRGRRPLRALAVGAEHRAGALVAADNPATGQPILDPTPWVGGVKPFVMETLLAVPHRRARTPSPAPPGRRTSTRSRRSARSNSPSGRADADLHRPVVAEHARRELERRRARPRRTQRPRHRRHRPSLAMQNLSGADASINCWNDKYYWDFWRPWNAIPRAAEDGNPATEPDAGWTPLITAPYPEHPSGHLCLDAAHTRVLRMFFGDVIEGGFQITSVSTFLQSGRCPHAHLRQLLAGARRDPRGPHLGRPALPHGGPPGGGARPERRRLPGGELLPARRTRPRSLSKTAPRSAGALLPTQGSAAAVTRGHRRCTRRIRGVQVNTPYFAPRSGALAPEWPLCEDSGP